MALLPRVLGQQQLRTRVVAGEEHHLLLDAFGVAIALEPRLAGVAEVVARLGHLELCGDEQGVLVWRLWLELACVVVRSLRCCRTPLAELINIYRSVSTTQHGGCLACSSSECPGGAEYKSTGNTFVYVGTTGMHLHARS